MQMMKLLGLLLVLIVFCALPCLAEETGSGPVYKDVPADHWAADAVKELSGQGIIKGYPDGTFRGDKPITRFELAVALARFVEVIAPPATKSDASSAIVVAKASPKDPDWAKNSQILLKSGKFLPGNSPIITDGSKPATAEDVAQAFASISARIIELRVPADETTEK